MKKQKEIELQIMKLQDEINFYDLKISESLYHIQYDPFYNEDFWTTKVNSSIEQILNHQKEIEGLRLKSYGNIYQKK